MYNCTNHNEVAGKSEHILLGLYLCYTRNRCGRHSCNILQEVMVHLIYTDNYDRLNMIGRESETRALIGCDSQ